MFDPKFTLIALIISLGGNLLYLFDTILGKVKPNRVSYFIWSLSALIIYSAQLSQGVGFQSLLTLTVGSVTLAIFIASLINKKAYWRLTKFDFICGFLSLLGLLLWYITKAGNLAIIFSLVGDAFAFLPTIRKSYTHPQTENRYTYLAGLVSAGIVLLSINIWNFETYSFSLYLFFMDFFVFLLIWIRSR